MVHNKRDVYPMSVSAYSRKIVQLNESSVDDIEHEKCFIRTEISH